MYWNVKHGFLVGKFNSVCDFRALGKRKEFVCAAGHEDFFVRISGFEARVKHFSNRKIYVLFLDSDIFPLDFVSHHSSGVFSAVPRVNQDCADFKSVAFGSLGLEKFVCAVDKGFCNVQNSVLDDRSICKSKFFIILQNKSITSPERNLMSVFFKKPRTTQGIPINCRTKFFGLSD